jgi:hypothetical protein
MSLRRNPELIALPVLLLLLSIFMPAQGDAPFSFEPAALIPALRPAPLYPCPPGPSFTPRVMPRPSPLDGGGPELI